MGARGSWRLVVGGAVMAWVLAGCFPHPPRPDVVDDVADVSDADSATSEGDTAQDSDGDADAAADTTADAGCTTPAECPDPGACHEATCTSGVCGSVIVGGACDDGDPCTLVDTCQAGSCVGSGRPDDTAGDWLLTIGGEGDERLAGVHATADGGVTVFGSFDASFSLGTDTEGHVTDLDLPAGEAGGAFIVEYDRDGQLRHGERIASATQALEMSNSAIHADGSMTIVGFWRGRLSVGTGPGAMTRESAEDGLFVIRLSRERAPIWFVGFTAPTSNLQTDLLLGFCSRDDGAIAVLPNFVGYLDIETPFDGTSIWAVPLLDPERIGLWTSVVILTPAGKIAATHTPESHDTASEELGVIGTACSFNDDGTFYASISLNGEIELSDGVFVHGSPRENPSPVLMAWSSATRLAWYRHFATAFYGAITGIVDAGDGPIIAVSDSRSATLAGESGDVPIPLWNGPALVALTPDGAFRWLTGLFTPDRFYFDSLTWNGHVLRGLGVQRDYVVFGDSSPPVTVGLDGSSQRPLTEAAFEPSTGKPLAALALARSDVFPQTEWPQGRRFVAESAAGTFVGSDFSSTMYGVRRVVAHGVRDAFIMRVNSAGGLDCAAPP